MAKNYISVGQEQAKERLDKFFKLPSIKKFKPITKSYGNTSSYGGNSNQNLMMMGRAGSTIQTLGFSPIIDRLQRYAEYAVMDYTAELQAGLDIFADDTTVKFIDGDVIHINCENEELKQELNDLYFNTLNLNFHLWGWVRDMLKFGDNFLLLDLQLEQGVVGALPMSVYEVERVEDMLDTENPIKFIINNQVNREFNIWEVAHFRMFGDHDFAPYGKSILESCRRYWRQITMLEDAMLIYRIVRSPERRVVYIDVAGLKPEYVDGYVNEIADTMKNNPIDVDDNGNFDFRWNPMSMMDDYIIPVRGANSGTKIDTLKGTSHLTDLQDIKYIQKKLVTSLKVPQRYLGLDDDQKSDLKNAAAQEDIRFSRTVERIQSMLISELKKIGIIHLILKGYDDQVAENFQILMKNPSSASEVEKLEVIKEKFGIAADILEGKLADRHWVNTNILNFTEDEIKVINKGLETDFEFMAKLNAYSGVWTKKYTQDGEKEYNIQSPQNALAGGMAGGAGAVPGQQEQEEPPDVAGEFKSKSIGGGNNIGGRMLARTGNSTILRPYESKNNTFRNISDTNKLLLNESKDEKGKKIENNLLKSLLSKNKEIVEEIFGEDDE